MSETQLGLSRGITRMDSPTLHFPVRCPVCSADLVAELRVSHVVRALHEGRPIRLHAACHDQWWNASNKDAEAIAEYLQYESLSNAGEITAGNSDEPWLMANGI